MPRLPLPAAITSIKKFYLPSTANEPKEKQAWIMMDVGFNTVADLGAIDQEDRNNAISGWRVFTRRIKDWNFVDSNGHTEPITIENVLRLDPVDKDYIRKIKFESSNDEAISAEKKSN